MVWRPPPPLAFLKAATACRRCRAELAEEDTFTLCAACDPPGAVGDEPAGEESGEPDAALAANRRGRRRWAHYAAVLAAADAAGWALYRAERSARSLSLYLEYWRPEAGGDPAAYRKVRVSDHDRRPKSGRRGGGADFAADWADLSAEFLFDPALAGPAAAEALAEVKEEAAAVFTWPRVTDRA